MNNLEIGKKFQIHCYKHDGSIHRAWDEAVLLEIRDECLIFGNERTKVTEADGRTWRTKEPAIMYFYKRIWFNVICQIKKDGIYYYCNMASPFIIEEDTIKYIDYDLDLRVFADGSYKVLDRGEYNYHKTKMNYPEKIDQILKFELKSLIDLAKSKKEPFDTNIIVKYNEKYNKFKTTHNNK